MDDQRNKLAHLPVGVRSHLEDYVVLLLELGGDRVDSVTLFGRVLDAAFDVETQAIRNILVAESVDLGLLRRISEQGVKLGGFGLTAPLFMTPEYISRSLDTFPLELLDIQMRHATVHGTDRFVGLEFNDADVRLQCERELKVVLIGMRQGLLASTGDERRLRGLGADVGEGLVRTLRGMLWLGGERDYLTTPALLDAMAKKVGRDLPGLRAALDAQEHGGWDQFQSLYADVEALGAMADAS